MYVKVLLLVTAGITATESLGRCYGSLLSTELSSVWYACISWSTFW